MRRELGIAAAAAGALSLVAGGGLWLYRRLRSEEDIVLELSPGPARDPAEQVSSEPLSRETRFDEELHEEERRRHEAAERLKDDPLAERLENGELT